MRSLVVEISSRPSEYQYQLGVRWGMPSPPTVATTAILVGPRNSASSDCSSVLSGLDIRDSAGALCRHVPPVAYFKRNALLTMTQLNGWNSRSSTALSSVANMGMKTGMMVGTSSIRICWIC
jgi:hypothetical protein